MLNDQTSTDPVVKLPPAFVAFHELYHKPYLRYAHTQLGNRLAAERAVRRTFTHLALSWAHVMRQSSPEAHAWKLLKQRVSQQQRADGHELAMVETAAFAHAALRADQDRFADLESGIGLYAAISRLPERQYDVIVLQSVLGYPTDKTARTMGVAQAAVRTHMRLAKRRLARELGIMADRDGGLDDG
jgi:DNA-directed RNA polymerase specialized sigma24 family protein